jgi:NAD(P)H-hydrate epimerase
VIDADGISVFRDIWKDLGSEALGELTAGGWVLTPHPGEYISLVRDSEFEVDKTTLFGNPLDAIVPLARKLQVVVVLKTHVVWVISPDGKFAVVDGMNPAMGTGGSGDVLSGVIAGIQAAGVETFEAAYKGAALHQEAGRKAFKRHGWFLAGELARTVSTVVDGDEHEAIRRS